MLTVEIADTSVWARQGDIPEFGLRFLAGLVGVTDMIVMELLYSARNAADFAQMEEDLGGCSLYRVEPQDWDEGRRVWRELLQRGGGPQHRQVGHQDLLTAAAAARHGLTVVHYDGDFDIIASVTGQPVRWAAPQGSLD
jgi:predicted nucleic acid-binding protein